MENVEAGCVRFPAQDPVLNYSLLTRPPSSLIVSSHHPSPPLESVRYGHELSSILSGSQNLWLFGLQDPLGHNPFDAFEGETGLLSHMDMDHKRFTRSVMEPQAFNGQHGRAYLFEGV